MPTRPEELWSTPGKGPIEFVPDGKTRDGRPMFKVLAPLRRPLEPGPGATPSQGKMFLDEYGHLIGPSHYRPIGVDQTVPSRFFVNKE